MHGWIWARIQFLRLLMRLIFCVPFFANVGLLTLFNIFLFQFCLKSSQTWPRSKLMVSFVGNLLAMNNLSVIKKLPFFSSQKVQFLSGYPY